MLRYLVLVTTFVSAAFLFGQDTPLPHFEVASIRPTPETLEKVNVGVHVDGARVTINAFSVKDYVRSAYGPGNPWYRRARAAGEGRVRAGGVERDVTFASAGAAVQGDIDAAYHAKY
ncbi:MAG: DUF2255 family protein, partial [Acidobacteriota bacterium]|nr:DUF2255 family protein [Acidobacteriota bacterium]